MHCCLADSADTHGCESLATLRRAAASFSSGGRSISYYYSTGWRKQVSRQHCQLGRQPRQQLSRGPRRSLIFSQIRQYHLTMGSSHAGVAPDNEVISYRGKQWTRRALGAFLNLIVLPGTGSFVLGRKIEGAIQLFLVGIGLGMKILGAAALAGRVGSEVGGINHSLGAADPGSLALQVAEAIQANPPSVLGVNSIWMVAGGLLVFLAGWFFSLVSSLLPPKGKAWTWT